MTYTVATDSYHGEMLAAHPPQESQCRRRRAGLSRALEFTAYSYRHDFKSHKKRALECSPLLSHLPRRSRSLPGGTCAGEETHVFFVRGGRVMSLACSVDLRSTYSAVRVCVARRVVLNIIRPYKQFFRHLVPVPLLRNEYHTYAR